jgi:hypothetical protein
MFGWVDRVMSWDEKNDGTPPTLVVTENSATPRNLSVLDRRLLELLSGAGWTHEDALRKRGGWTKWEFLKATTRLILMDWIVARPAGLSIFGKSVFRLNPEVSDHAERTRLN